MTLSQPSLSPSPSGTSRRGFLTAIAAAGALAVSPRARAQSSNAVGRSVGRFVTVDGNRIWIEERGRGIPILMSAGGQNRVETMRPLAEKLAAKYRVITWDRANMGRSDLVLKGSRDVDIWTDQQAGIMDQLKARPGYLVGASSGSRVAYTMALRYPDYARGVFTYLTTGGGTIGESLAKQYYFDYADLAEKSGMEAVAKTPFWAERIALNPANQQKLLSMDPHEFAAVMRRFGKAMRSSDVVIGITADELRQIKANGTPVGITQGCAEAPAASPRPLRALRAAHRRDADPHARALLHRSQHRRDLRKADSASRSPRVATFPRLRNARGYSGNHRRIYYEDRSAI